MECYTDNIFIEKALFDFKTLHILIQNLPTINAPIYLEESLFVYAR